MFRAYHAIRNLSTDKGEHTGAIYGVINMIKKLINDQCPDYFAVVFDPKGKNFRNDLYPEYKANRPPLPEDLEHQILPIHRIIKALGIPLLMIDKVEADDVIGTLAKHAEEKNIDTIISSGDKDLAQLVNPHIKMINTMSNILLDKEGVKQKYDVYPEQMIDYLSLVGDSVDNIPGVPKVGPKTAAKWLADYSTLSNIINNADKISGKVGENLRNSLDQLALSQTLVTLKTDVDLEYDIEDLKISELDIDTLREEYQRWQLNSWLVELGNQSTHGLSGNKDQPEYETILSLSSLEKWLKKINKASLVSFDCETTSLDYMQAEIVGVSFSVSGEEAAYVPLTHDYPDAPVQLKQEQVLEKLKPILGNDHISKLGQNLKYDMSILARYGIDLCGIKHDTMLQSYVYDSTAGRHDMDSMADRYLDYKTIRFEDIAGKGSKQVTFNQVPIEDAGPYAAEDAAITYRLHEYFWPRISKQKKLKFVYEEIEIPLLPVLSRMERHGVMVDADMLYKQSSQLSGRMDKIQEEIFHIANEEFNIGSPKQIQYILYEKLGLPVLAKTPKGQPSTAESVLQDLANEYELPRLILEHRSLSKLKSTYTDKLPGQINPQTGRVHTSYHQAVAATGRLSSSDPNLQNIPVRSEDGRQIRKAFTVPKGHKILAADYSQIELRIMAHLSQDKGLLKAFQRGEDIHITTAAEIFNIEPGKVDPLHRRTAKTINFGLIYGMSPFGLAKQLDIDRSKAKEFVDRYFEKYPGVKEFMDHTRSSAREQGFVETVYGRRLYLPEINAKNAARRQYAERTAINAPMQGSAADIIKLAMIRVDQWLQDSGIDAKLIMQVHDELVLEVHEDSIELCRKQIKNLMVKDFRIDVEIDVDIGIGENWDEAH